MDVQNEQNRTHARDEPRSGGGGCEHHSARKRLRKLGTRFGEREMEIYIDQLENVELISDKAMAINGGKTDVDVRAFSMEQFERARTNANTKKRSIS